VRRRLRSILAGLRAASVGAHLGGTACEYREVVENERLVYTEFVADEDGNVLAPPAWAIPDGHRVATEVRVELEDVDSPRRPPVAPTLAKAGLRSSDGFDRTTADPAKRSNPLIAAARSPTPPASRPDR
jgi:uncharacterized protein YndB with AHSA1/START domain